MQVSGMPKYPLRMDQDERAPLYDVHRPGGHAYYTCIRSLWSLSREIHGFPSTWILRGALEHVHYVTPLHTIRNIRNTQREKSKKNTKIFAHCRQLFQCIWILTLQNILGVRIKNCFSVLFFKILSSYSNIFVPPKTRQLKAWFWLRKFKMAFSTENARVA